MNKSDRWTALNLLLALMLVLAAMAVLNGCSGVRLSDDQAQALSNAREGALAAAQKREAIRAEVDPAVAAEMAQELLDDLGRGVAGFTLAASIHAPLPAPTFQRALLLENPHEPKRYAEEAQVAATNPPKGWSAGAWAAFGATALTAVGGALSLLKNVPGVGGVAATVAEGVWRLIAPAKAKEAEEAVDDSLDIAIAYGERLAHVLTNAGLGHVVEDAKLRAMFWSEKLGATNEIKRRLASVRKGDVTLPSLPADTRQVPVVREPPPA